MIEALHSADAVLGEVAPLLQNARLHHINTRRQPLSFTTKPFLVELYRDMPKLPEVALCKCTQVGVSELLIQHAFRSSANGRIVAYVLPASEIRNGFVARRINELILDVPEYRRQLPGASDVASAERTLKAGSVQRKRFGRGWLLFLGSNTDGDFVELSADDMIIDEYDLCDPGNVARARDRLRESKAPREVFVGNPTLPGRGISKVYDESDGRLWHHTCGRCGERQPLLWEENIVERGDNGVWVLRDRERADGLVRRSGRDVLITGRSDVRPVCRKCRRPFDRESMTGEWVAERVETGRSRGYRISRLDVLNARLVELYKEFVRALDSTVRLAAFYNGALGRAYEGAGTGLVYTDLEACARGEPGLDYNGTAFKYADEQVSMGVDVGAVLHVSISIRVKTEGPEVPGMMAPTVRRAVWVGTVPGFDDLRDLAERFKVRTCVIDANPETHSASAFRDAMRNRGGTCRVWLCQFHRQDRVTDERYGRTIDENASIVRVDRTQSIDAATLDIQNGGRLYPADVFTVLGWSEQMIAPRRVLNKTGTRFVWTEHRGRDGEADEHGSASSPDHFRFADLYDLIAADLAGMAPEFWTASW